MWWLYQLLIVVGYMLYVPKALWRSRLPHAGWRMRLGRYPAPVLAALGGRRPIWVHAVSVGEALAAKPLLEALTQAYPDTPLVLSSITPGGFEIMSKHAEGRGAAIYFPLDLQGCVNRALATLRPTCLLLVESELWPIMIKQAKAHGVPIAVVNGRMSPRAHRRYRRIRSWLTGMLDSVESFLMQSQDDADRLIQLGAPPGRVRVLGTLKWDASLGSRPSEEELRSTAERVGLNGADPVFVAGSTHRGEEETILAALKTLRETQPRLRLILAPRHLERLDEVEDLIRQVDLTVVRLSQVHAPQPWDVGLVDKFGRLPLYYGLATVAFVGGSLIPRGGQNPLEPASLGKPVVFGPSMHNFPEITRQLLGHQAARQLEGKDQLTLVLQECFANTAEASAMGHRARELTECSRGVTDRTLAALRPILAR